MMKNEWRSSGFWVNYNWTISQRQSLTPFIWSFPAKVSSKKKHGLSGTWRFWHDKGAIPMTSEAIYLHPWSLHPWSLTWNSKLTSQKRRFCRRASFSDSMSNFSVYSVLFKVWCQHPQTKLPLSSWWLILRFGKFGRIRLRFHPKIFAVNVLRLPSSKPKVRLFQKVQQSFSNHLEPLSVEIHWFTAQKNIPLRWSFGVIYPPVNKHKFSLKKNFHHWSFPSDDPNGSHPYSSTFGETIVGWIPVRRMRWNDWRRSINDEPFRGRVCRGIPWWPRRSDLMYPFKRHQKIVVIWDTLTWMYLDDDNIRW